MTNSSSLTSGAIIYQVLDHDIHFVRFEESSRQSATSLFQLLERLYVSSAEAGYLCMLIDSVDEAVPITATVRDGIALENRYPQHVPVFVALMHHHPLASLLDVMLRPLRSKNQIRLFAPDKREQAIAWLLERQNAIRATHAAHPA